MKNNLLKFFVVAFFALTSNEILSNSCKNEHPKTCGANNVRQHKFPKNDDCNRRQGYKKNQKINRKAKSCCN